MSWQHSQGIHRLISYHCREWLIDHEGFSVCRLLNKKNSGVHLMKNLEFYVNNDSNWINVCSQAVAYAKQVA